MQNLTGITLDSLLLLSAQKDKQKEGTVNSNDIDDLFAEEDAPKKKKKQRRKKKAKKAEEDTAEAERKSAKDQN